MTGEAFKVKIVEQGNEAIVIKLSDPEAGAPLQEGAPATAVEEACSRSDPSSCNEVHQRMAQKKPTTRGCTQYRHQNGRSLQLLCCWQRCMHCRVHILEFCDEPLSPVTF